MVRLNLFQQKKEETKQQQQQGVVKIEPPNPPPAVASDKVEEPPKASDPVVEYVEREITLSLINDKLNILNSKLDEIASALGGGRE